MPRQSDRAIVLRLSEYSETSQIATLLCERAGLVRVIAKGARRSTKTRPAAGLDLLELGDAQFTAPAGESSLGTLTEWVQRDAFLRLRRSMPALLAGLYAAEAVTLLTQEQDPHPRMFADWLALVGALSDAAPVTNRTDGSPAEASNSRPRARPQPLSDPIAALVRFQAALLKEVGFAPELRRCTLCGAARVAGASAYFSSTAGGYVCGDCAPRAVEKQPIRPGLLDGRKGSNPPIEWFALMDYHIACIVGRPPHSGALLRATVAK